MGNLDEKRGGGGMKDTSTGTRISCVAHNWDSSGTHCLRCGAYIKITYKYQETAPRLYTLVRIEEVKYD